MGPIYHETIFFLRSNPLLFIFSIAGWLLLPLHLVASLVMYLMRIRVLTSHVGVPSFRFIGHLALEMDAFFKECYLNGQLPFTPLVIFPRDLVANKTLLNLWSQKCLIISNPISARLLRPFAFLPWSSYSIRKYIPSIGLHVPSQVFKDYGNRQPMLKLTAEVEDVGREYLKKHGVSWQDWYVCLHVRTSGYYENPEMDLRNSNINNYLEAVEEIIKRGGWVFRMGDPSMPAVPQMSKVIDYARSSEKSELLDIFLPATCRFFLGSPSGLSAVASVFGVPTATANQCGPPFPMTITPGDIFIPKVIRDTSTKSVLTYIDLLETQLSEIAFTRCLHNNQLTAEENNPTEIRELALDMIDKLEGKELQDDFVDQTRTIINSKLNHKHVSFSGAGQISSRFIMGHKHDFFRASRSFTTKLSPLCGDDRCPCLRR